MQATERVIGMGSEKHIHIGFSNIGLLFSVFWPIVGYSVQQEALKQNVNLSLRSAQDIEEHIMHLRYFLKQKVDVVLISPVLSGNPELMAIAAEVNAAGIPIVTLNQEVGPDQQHCTVRSDHIKTQATIAEYIFQQLGGKGKIVHLQGDIRTEIAMLRSKGFHDALAQYPNIELAYEADGDWSQESGSRLMSQALAEHPDISGVIAANDEMALGANEVIEKAGQTGKILVAGIDALPETLIAIRNNKITATMRQVASDMAHTALEMCLKAFHQESVPSLVYSDTKLITAENLVEGMIEEVKILPDMLRHMAENNETQQHLQQEIIEVQQRAIHELSTPVIPIMDGIIVLPLIGNVDSMRARDITRSLLAGISQHKAKIVILDVTGVKIMDTGIVNHLNKTIQAAQLKGAQTIVTGISDAVAESIVDLGIDWSQITTLSNLQTGLMTALNRLGIRLAV